MAYHKVFMSWIWQIVMTLCMNIFHISIQYFQHFLAIISIQRTYSQSSIKFQVNEGYLLIITWKLFLSNWYRHHAVIMKQKWVMPWHIGITLLPSFLKHLRDHNYSNSASEFTHQDPCSLASLRAASLNCPDVHFFESMHKFSIHKSKRTKIIVKNLMICIQYSVSHSTKDKPNSGY